MGNGSKICMICNEDCKGKPRIKDKKGRYYHKACYEKAKARQEAPAAPPTDAALDPLPILDGEPGGYDPFDDLKDSPPANALPAGTNACPSCGNALQADSVLCMNCGHNLRGGQQVSTKVGKPKKVRGEGGGGGVIFDLIKNPLVVSAAYVITMPLVFMTLKAFPDNYVAGGIFILVYLLMSLSIFVGILFEAFRESVFTGFLTFFLPFYILYFVYGVSESAWVKCLFTANILVQIMVVVMIR